MERLGVTRTGIPGMPELPWGTHLCMFYETLDDLMDIIVPYVVAGLEDGEAALAIMRDAPRKAELEARVRAAQPAGTRSDALEVVTVEDGYLRAGGDFEGDRTLALWNRNFDVAIQRGYAGLRACGDEAWLTSGHWRDFHEYEERLGGLVAGRRMLILCAYSLEGRKGNEVFDVAHSHQFVLAKRHDEWQALETADLARSKKELEAVRADLEWRVLSRTEQLSAANARLNSEIAERTRAERALRESEARFRTAFTWSPIATAIMHGKDSRIIDANDAFARLLGYQRSELLGRDTAELSVWVDPGQRERAFAILHEAGSIHGFDFRARTRTGQMLDLLGFGETIDLDGEPAYLATVLDLTARRRAERALLEQQWLLNESERLTHTGSWRWTPSTGEAVWSRELYRIHGQDPELFRPSFESWLELVHPQDRAAFKGALDAAVQNRGGYSIEHRIVRPDGSTRVLLSVGYCRVIEPDPVPRLIGYSSDVSERRDIERSRRDTAEQLTAMSRHLVDLQESQRRLLAAELHDRIGQNLTAIGLNLDIVAREMEAGRGASVTARLEDAAALLEATMDAVSDVAAELRPPMLDDLGLVPTLQWYAREFTARTAINVSFDAHDPAVRLPPDVELAVFRIVQEALTNVARHARAQNAAIRFETGADCALSICDDGIGPQAVPTGRADQGLGLITMRERASAVGGELRFGRGPDGGTCVTVVLPCVSRPR